MTWWIPFPESFNHDPRVRALSRAARGVLAQLVIAARGTGSIPYVNHHGALGTVLLIALCEGDARDAAEAIGREFGEIVGCRLASADDAAQRLVLHFGQSAEAPRAKEQASAAPSPAPFRRKPSEGPAAVNLRAARSHFKARRREWSGVAPGVTWEQWLATPAGVAWLQRPCNAPGGVAATPATPPCNTPATPPSPHTPLPRKEGEKQNERSDTREAATPLQHPATPPVAAVVRCGTVERLTGFDAAALLDRMREASGDRLTLMLPTSAHGVEFVAFARALVEGGGTTGSLVRAAGHAAHLPPGSWLAKQGKLGLHRLMAHGGKILLDLLAASETCALCGGTPLAADDDPSSAEAADIEAARRAYHATSGEA